MTRFSVAADEAREWQNYRSAVDSAYPEGGVDAARVALVANIAARLRRLEGLLSRVEDDFAEDVYRMWHRSFKVFGAQHRVREVHQELLDLHPVPVGDYHRLDVIFEKIVADSLVGNFNPERSNANWSAEARPIIEGLFHTREALRHAIWTAKNVTVPPKVLPYPYAALISLYRLR